MSIRMSMSESVSVGMGVSMHMSMGGPRSRSIATFGECASSLREIERGTPRAAHLCKAKRERLLTWQEAGAAPMPPCAMAGRLRLSHSPGRPAAPPTHHIDILTYTVVETSTRPCNPRTLEILQL